MQTYGEFLDWKKQVVFCGKQWESAILFCVQKVVRAEQKGTKLVLRISISFKKRG
jgi:hypothetical protein